MPIDFEYVREWLNNNYYGYSAESEPIKGTYGLIWFLNSISSNSRPKSFAVKTVDPNKAGKSSTTEDIAILRREFRMWLALPETYNVMPALGFDTATFSDNETSQSVTLPFMRMPRMKGSLDAWVLKPPSGSEVADRLIALAQSLNGLQYLYDQGLEGHGDLKPSNLLYDDLRTKFQLRDEEAWPSTAHPWRIRVADLGWADAWVDLGHSNKVLRTHMAPERIDGNVVPVKSDIFSMGIIAAELLQGRHPAENLKARTKSEGSWKKWAAGGEETRNLSGISSTKLQAVIRKCLSSSPAERPDPLEFLNEICVELRTNFGIEIAQTLELWRSGTAGDEDVVKNERFSWAAKHSLHLDAAEAKISRKQLLDKLRSIEVVDFRSCEEWASLANGFVQLTASEIEEGRRIRTLATEYLIRTLGALDRNEVAQLGVRSDWPTLRPFEQYAMLVEKLEGIANLDGDERARLKERLGPYAKSTLIYLSASELRSKGENQAAIAMLTDAIVHSPSEPMFYYSRAEWKHEAWLLHHVLPSKSEIPKMSGIEDIVRDLQKATSLEPNWDKPKRLFETLRQTGLAT